MKNEIKKMKILLINPPFTQSRKAMKRCIVPLGIAYLAAVLEKEGIDVQIVDCVVEAYNKEKEDGQDTITYGLFDEDVTKIIEEFHPDFVGVSCLISAQAHNAYRMCTLTKEVNPRIETIMGGTHASALPNEVIKDNNVDHVLVGEGEISIFDILYGKKNGIVLGEFVDLGELPWPARHLLPMEKYIEINMPTSVYSPHKRVTQIETTRGCPFKCSFCATTNFKGKPRMRPVKNVLDEIRMLKDRYGVEELDIIDSNFVVNKKRTIELLKGIREIGISWANPGGIWLGGLDNELLDIMKDSGCYQLSLAVESSTPRILNEVIRKPTNIEMVESIVEHSKKIGIDLHAFFVSGFPEQTLEEMKSDYRFAKKMGFTSASFNIINALPGSDLYRRYKDKVDFSRIDLRKANLPHPEIGKDELEKMIHKFNRKFNFSLIYRNPTMFFKKYLGTLLRKPSFRIMLRIFNRQ